MDAPLLDRLGMLVVHAYVDPLSNELRASVTFAGHLTETESTHLATSREEILDLVRVWLDRSDAAGDGRVTARLQDPPDDVDRVPSVQ